MAPEKTGSGYVPAAGWRAFTRLYDPVLARTMREKRFRGEMLRRVEPDLPEGGTAVDVGCGTGTFALALKQRRPDARVVGVDGDAEILGLAQVKQGAAGIEWREGLAQELPLEAESADVVTTSLMLHHLLPDDKRKALAEMKRILKPGGRLHVADWGRPSDPLMSALFYVVQIADGFDRTADHRAGQLPAFIEDAGFGSPERYGRIRTGFGVIELLTAKPAAA
ncbi:MAG TPA: class I SAM-dependent methyltransferase [Solirubrobacterales bacterium]|nr:class I SAM-dependent methyltransferase [Solirubrobacterales bacterium]